MASIRVHGSPISTATARILACLYEKDLDYEFVLLDMKNNEHKKHPFLSINPFGQVPGFQDGDLTIFESRAITQYLAKAYASKGTQLISDDPKKAAIILTWIEVEGHHYDPPAVALSFEHLVKPQFGLGETDPAAVAENETKLGKVLDIYENQLSKNKFLAGDEFSLADLHHIPNVSYLSMTPSKKLFESRPRVNAWVAEITARPSWAKVVALRNQS
ncbi:glutathione S-transferase PARB-like [Benincasa hispida]|uniref:glutathione S-transferase PARB-like n=1 Tax=Benincasa hispida TaxID=102211 RepID=UPI0018FFE35F|nr:glutathione S-transferase PARB-like [Benincasa hispida]